MSEHLIALEDVTKYYHMGDSIVKAVDGINVVIEKGDFVAIMGPSGSGKSIRHRSRKYSVLPN